MAYNYQTISTHLEDGVMTATMSNPPINVMTPVLYNDLVAFTAEVEVDEAVRVLVLESADPDFFIAHFDLETILEFPTDTAAQKSDQLSDFHAMCERVRTMPKPTIAKIAGRVGGGGSEFSSACDMRFGLLGKTVVNQMEVPLGILPGGGGTQHLPRLLGRGRAMEVILGGIDMDAETAEKWGYLNRAFETPAELDAYVSQLANRMALWPPHAIALAKESTLNSALPIVEGLKEEAYLFQQTLRNPASTQNMKKALELGAQTREGEMRIADLSEEVGLAAKKD
ncbi:MAG: enoyl-CoA hydratase/isomerase family protein [Pseudomonadales bacterium]|jgi:enoyl-CoA hydratase/carnithine racemase|tara:strand:- start:16031 stop:16879 length:849 start_codon:yes stop_codon:yes gene_type:complete